MSTLYVVATPIGNLGDLSPRAAEALKSADRILAEDTRRTRVLAEHVGARSPMVSLHAHNERERARRVVEWLDAGETLALVSDAGTPLVSDPGGRLVQVVVEAGHDVVPIPGPSAVLAALVGSGLSGDRFVFLGFPERKGRARAELLERVARAGEPVVLFESPQRLVRLLEELAEACGAGRGVSVARELTKLHEEFVRGTLAEALAHYREHPPRGEVSLVVAPAETGSAEAGSVEGSELEGAVSIARELLAQGTKPSEAARELTRRLPLSRNAAYRIVHDVAEPRKEEGP
jgi:16S rRNA (cytidine1402-2'-O)-methyltransferase